MCGIAGALIRKSYIQTPLLADVIINTSARGRDSWGVVNITKDGVYEEKQLGRARTPLGRFELFPEKFQRFNSTVIANLRAEPTTEYVKEKTTSDIQPFQVGKWVIAHNGTIANDHAIEAMYGKDMPEKRTKIDSEVIPRLLYRLGKNFTQVDLDEFLINYVVGSYAFAIGHLDYPGFLYLATNYKPIYVGTNGNDSHVFSSHREALIGYGIHDVIPMPQYSSVFMTPSGATQSVLKDRVKSRSLVICSGGLDSTVAAAWSVKKLEAEKTTLLHFKYGCRAEEKEVEAIEKISENLGIDYMLVNTPVFKDVIKGSPLTGTLAKIAGGEAGAEFAHEWVPARNLIMLSLAVGIAEGQGYNFIVIGTNLEESGAYPDNEPEFIRRFATILPYAVAANVSMSLAAPVQNLMKHEIVKRGIELDAPLHLTWSCYEGGDVHCGDCGPCYMRRVAYQINNAEDPITYEKA